MDDDTRTAMCQILAADIQRQLDRMYARGENIKRWLATAVPHGADWMFGMFATDLADGAHTVAEMELDELRVRNRLLSEEHLKELYRRHAPDLLALARWLLGISLKDIGADGKLAEAMGLLNALLIADTNPRRPAGCFLDQRGKGLWMDVATGTSAFTYLLKLRETPAEKRARIALCDTSYMVEQFTRQKAAAYGLPFPYFIRQDAKELPRHPLLESMGIDVLHLRNAQPYIRQDAEWLRGMTTFMGTGGRVVLTLRLDRHPAAMRPLERRYAFDLLPELSLSIVDRAFLKNVVPVLADWTLRIGFVSKKSDFVPGYIPPADVSDSVTLVFTKE